MCKYTLEAFLSVSHELWQTHTGQGHESRRISGMATTQNERDNVGRPEGIKEIKACLMRMTHFDENLHRSESRTCPEKGWKLRDSDWSSWSHGTIYTQRQSMYLSTQNRGCWKTHSGRTTPMPVIRWHGHRDTTGWRNKGTSIECSCTRTSASVVSTCSSGYG